MPVFCGILNSRWTFVYLALRTTGTGQGRKTLAAMPEDMIVRRFINIFFITLLLCSCSEEPSALEQLKDHNTPAGPYTYFGVRIMNELPHGAVYLDSTGEMNAFRSVRAFITNDTLIPIYLQINLPTQFVNLDRVTDEAYKELVKTDRKYRIFILPDTMTWDKQFTTNSKNVSNNLATFLDNSLPTAGNLTKVIQPRETYTLNLGYLFIPSDGLTRSEFFSKGHPHNLYYKETEKSVKTIDSKYFDLMLAVNVYPPYYYSKFTCGQVKFSE